jgi:hypothetical protein
VRRRSGPTPLSSGLGINLLDRYGRTPLHIASLLGSEALVEEFANKMSEKEIGKIDIGGFTATLPGRGQRSDRADPAGEYAARTTRLGQLLLLHCAGRASKELAIPGDRPLAGEDETGGYQRPQRQRPVRPAPGDHE